MDNIKKLEGTYLSDNKDRKDRVLLGLSGSIESLVSAYLLKIQKYDLIAVTVLTSWDTLPSEKKHYLSCHLNQDKVNFLKEFCLKLGISHHIVEVKDEFREEVIEKWMSDKILGLSSNHCFNCHDLRMRILFEKRRDLNATFLATGHYGKIFQAGVEHSVVVHSSGDEVFDQSHLLSRLPQDILSSLLLPLADISSKEVIKLAENFGIQSIDSEIKFNKCLRSSKEVDLILEKCVAKSLIKEGDVLEYGVKHSLLKHDGVHHHQIGEPLSHKEQQMDSSKVMGEYFFSEKNIVLIDESVLFRDKIVLVNCQFSNESSFIEPQKAAIKISNGMTIDCIIFPRSLSTVVVELSEKVKVVPNQMATLFKKKGKNAKVLLSGEIKFHLADLVKEGEQSEETSHPLLDF